MKNFFDVINDLTSSKIYNYEECEEYINIWLINRGMSNFMDCIMHANELNIRQNISKKQLYDYYHVAIQPKKKRFAKWAKPDKDTQLELIQKYYKCNLRVAEQYFALLTEDDIKLIQEKMFTGGRK